MVSRSRCERIFVSVLSAGMPISASTGCRNNSTKHHLANFIDRAVRDYGAPRSRLAYLSYSTSVSFPDCGAAEVWTARTPQTPSLLHISKGSNRSLEVKAQAGSPRSTSEGFTTCPRKLSAPPRGGISSEHRSAEGVSRLPGVRRWYVRPSSRQPRGCVR